MADIFIAYDREDLNTTERLAAVFQSRGWSVFWDRQVPGGPRFDKAIPEELGAARCVVVLWSRESIESECVVEEAEEAKKREILIPVRIEDVEPPYGFRRRNFIDLVGWQDDGAHSGLNRLLGSVSKLLAQPPKAAPKIPPAYLEWLRRTYTNVDLLGQEADKSHAFQLDHVYVPALTSAPSPADTTDEAKTREAGERRFVPLLQRVDEESLYVLAQAGAGKSTFCRWAVLCSIRGDDPRHPVPAPEEYAEPVPEHLRGRLPVLVPFRDFAPRTDWGRGGRTWIRADLERALAAWVDAAVPNLPEETFTANLNAGTTFLLLDGLDELPQVETLPRDGVTVYPRELVVSGLADALPVWLEAGNRVLLTSRPAGMERAGLHRLGLDPAPLDPLPEELQHLFVRRWFHTLRKTELADGLIATLGDRGEELAPLAENPMLLTALCILFDTGGRLPEDRYKLYRRIVDNVLSNRFPGGTRQTEPVMARLEAIALRMHEGEAGEPRPSPAPAVSELEVDQVLREIADEGWCDEDRRVEPAIRRNELLEKSGLLLPRPDQSVAFYHLSLQEYLAAERILKSCEFSDELEGVFKERGVTPEWRLTLLFLFAGKVDATRADWGPRLLGRLIDDLRREALKANPAPAVFIAEALDLILSKKRPLPEPVGNAYVRLVLDAIADEIALSARHALALTLGWLGDPRIPDLRDPWAYVEVPAGRYALGDEGETVEITEPFRIGRYPVTNGQYQAFIDGGGYREHQWWSDGGWKWLQEKKVTEPGLWRDRRWNAPNQPVVAVSLWEAEACAAWAGGRLSTEQEWEAAARGLDGFRYPWGNDWEDGICNTFESGLGRTSAVGLFPRSRQVPLGIEDMVGNVWEWCGSLYDPRNVKDSAASRVLRGGSWRSSQVFARAALRSRYSPVSRLYSFGFRVVCSSPSSGTES